MGREEAVADKETMRAGGHIGAESHAWVPVQGSRSGRRRLGADSRIGQLQEQVERVVTEVNGEPATRRVQRLQMHVMRIIRNLQQAHVPHLRRLLVQFAASLAG